jgi:hypothetical protein
MATEVDICNLALSRIGDRANVSSISPVDGSAQSQHCARFYPMARDTMLEMHPWGFATTRLALALVGTNTTTEWDYTYQEPNDLLNVLAVLPPDAADDYSTALPAPNYFYPGAVVQGGAIYSSQPYSCEIDPLTGSGVIYSDQANAVLRYSKRVSDPQQFSPLFTDALSWLLASYLAGAIVKGSEGAQLAQTCRKAASDLLAQATMSDANQGRATPVQSTPWITGR